MLHSEINDNLLDKPVLLFNWNFKLKSSSKFKRLFHLEGSEKYIILLDITTVFLEGLLVDWDLVIEENVTR